MEHSIPAHPEGVEPQGQLFVEPERARRRGDISARGPRRRRAPRRRAHRRRAGAPRRNVLATLAGASRVFGAFARFDELWKARCLRRSDGGLLPPWRGSWHATVVAAAAAGAPTAAARAALQRRPLPAAPPGALAEPLRRRAKGPAVQRARLFKTRPRRLRERFEADGGSPVVLEGLGEDAVASGAWTAAALEARYGDRVYHAGGVNFRLADYLRYGASNADDPPFYVFDPTVGASTPELLAHYAVPEYFQDDLFDLLDDGSARLPTKPGDVVYVPRAGGTWC
ncbi:hypothetical protein JL720_8068 [Aureococcus anophagefferens]|nr:hypothetical protein JL720_8068 [Aureococcus anophagefferens]